MFIFQEGQRVYLPAWEFNTCRVLGCLAEIIEQNGGKVKPFRHVMASNRTYEPGAEPQKIYGQGYIRFVYDGMMYYFQIDSNPFFDHYYTKATIREDGKVCTDIYAENLSREWIYDCLFRIATDDDIREIAEVLFGLLKNAKVSMIYRDRRKVTVYQYESKPVRYAEVDF